jgi:CHASE2 domain-containing sensor protein
MNWKPLLGTLSRKPKAYWLFAAGSIALGMYCGTWLGKNGAWVGLRYRLYQGFEWFSPHPPLPKRTVLVLVDDDEYWTKRPARRIPIRRDYLADVLTAVSACDPAVIALDFDLRSPITNGALKDNPEYTDETQTFITKLESASKKQPIVLPATLDRNDQGRYVLDSTIYDGTPLRKDEVQVGYIQLPYDVRQVPTAATLPGGGRIDSFAEAIVRAINEDLLGDLDEEESVPFGTFIKEEKFKQVLASAVLSEDNAGACKPIKHNIAIIGASWHRDSRNKGNFVDTHLTPLGSMRGAFVHANYVEALLDSRTYRPLGENYSMIIEFVFSALVALLLALEIGGKRKVSLVGALCFAVMLVSYVFWQNLGIFFDFFFPVVFLVTHALIDYVRELQIDANHYRRLHVEGA